MSAAGLVRRGRRMAESLMLDRCEIRAPSTAGDLDPETGTRPTVPGALVYSGRCKVQTYEAHEQTPQSGQHVYSVQRYYVHIPAGTVVPTGHEVRIVECVLDATVVDRTYRVAGGLHKSMATANRLVVDEVTA